MIRSRISRRTKKRTVKKKRNIKEKRLSGVERSRDLGYGDEICIEQIQDFNDGTAPFVELVDSEDIPACDKHEALNEKKEIYSDSNNQELWFLNGYCGDYDPRSLLMHVCEDGRVKLWSEFLQHFSEKEFSKIGEGAFSEVYTAKSLLDHSTVVLKVVPVDEGTNVTMSSKPSKTFLSILPEVLIYREIELLSS
ncbi:unnamed protein product, partial [Anisakis simplex]|uniref:Protein kinase domain-containing protein n=1 Tax=Anisakis simplex TaxID=6269 RepID=A0A0M3J5X9_ANISI